ENLDALPEIYDGREITRELLAQLPVGADLLSPEVVALYYQRYYSSPRHRQDMRYRVPALGDGTMLDLLCCNVQGVQAFLESGRQPACKTDLCQAFGTAEAAFAAIPDETVPVLVPYGAGREKLLDLRSGLGGAALLRELQPYTVAIGHSQCRRLGDGIYPALDGAVLILREEYYDSAHKGLTFEPAASPLLLV